MVTHGVITGALFLCVGVIYERTHDRTIAKMGGLGRRPRRSMPRSSASSCWPASALPGLAGFVGEFLVLLGTSPIWPCAAAIAAFAMIFGAVYLLWMFQRVVFGEPPTS